MSSMEDSEVIDRRKLFTAAMDGDIGFFEEARHNELENCVEGYFLRQTSSDKYNILHIAIKYRQYEFIKKVFVDELLRRAVTDKLINERDNDGNTPLHAAAEEGHIEALELLLEYGKGQQEANKETKPLDWSVQNKDGNTPLYVALIKRKFKAVEWLVKQQPEVAGVTNNDGNTPLHVAAEVDAASIFKVLIDENVEWQPTWRVKNKEGNTPLHLAIINYNWNETATLMLELYPELARVTNCSMETPLHLAIIKFPFLGRIIQKLEDKNNPRFLRISMEPDLENAAKNGDVRVLKETKNREIENGNYFVGQNSNGDNFLHVAVRSEEFKYKYEFIEQVTKRLPTSIIDKLISQRNNNGDTLFHVAAEFGNIRNFKLLLEFDESGKSNEQNSNGNTPLQVALFHGKLHLVNFILGTGDPLLKRFVDIDGEFIERMVFKDSSVACWHDIGGLTVLHRAACIPNATFSLKVIKMILECCPESAKEVDKNSGKTILHFLINRVSTYQQAKELLQIPQVGRLKDVKDYQGKTPLDLAWISNFKMARYLFHYSTTSTSHAHQPIDFDQMKKTKKRTLEEYGVIDRVNIQFIREKISKFGINFLSSRDSKRRNVLHNLMRLERRTPIEFDEYLDFIKQVVNTHPILSAQTDINGDTPIHILMQNPHDTKIYRSTTQSLNSDVTYTLLTKSSLPFELLVPCVISFESARDEGEDNAGETKEEGRCHFKYDSPLLVQNMEGNTPLHEALKANHILPALLLIKKFSSSSRTAFGLTNKRKETLLHLLVGSSLVEWPRDVIEEIHDSNVEAANSQDQDGLTPIMRAVQVGHIDTVKTLDDLNQEASKIVDNNGQTLWHMLVNQPSSKTEEFVNDIGKKHHLIDLLKIRDNDGKTPLHLAFESRRFTHARLFLECSGDDWCHAKKIKWMKELPGIQDGDGITSPDRLASISDLPQDFVKLLKSNALVVGIRSIWDVPTSQISEYANTMGVVAALITTITFAAAFAVPGGLVQDKGSPILIRKAAFQAFMISDILAMCLSMMVLFCLLWVVATTDKRKSVVLMDFSMFLLLLAFYATLVTFMTGVYVTTIHDNHWIAIINLILCSLLMLLMHKNFVMNYLVPAVEVALIMSSWMRWPKVR